MPAETLLLAEDALAFDFAPAAAGARTFVGSRSSVMAYVAAIRAVPLGAQPLQREGVTASFDPLEQDPAMAQALSRAQWNANQVVGHLDTLHRWSSGSVRELAAEVLKPIVAMRDAIAAVPSGGTLSPEADRDTLMNMMMARVWTSQIAAGVDLVRRGLHSFLTNLRDDHDTLASGSIAIGAIRSRIQQHTSEVAQRYILGPEFMRWAGALVLDIGRARLEALAGVENAIVRALEGHQGMRGGMDAFASGAESIGAKYAAAQGALASADAPTRSMALRKYDFNRAIRSWEDFRDFILQAGF
ncbi:MAG TPA: hypothetical protein VND45_06850 [Thermoanaerobaculia bacterium]|jgi:hypothetical protein|nr:hypothetical protein [Thermoanaerobaculia bacterium]